MKSADKLARRLAARIAANVSRCGSLSLAGICGSVVA